jgi:hypothetical protein
MAKPFTIDITARDKTQAGIRAAEQRFRNLQRPLDRLATRTDRWGGGTAIARVTRGLTGIAAAGGDAAAGLGRATLGTAGLGTVATATSWALGGLVGAAVLATAAGARFGIEWAKSATETTRAARGIGLSGQSLQQWQLAGRLAGVEAEALTASMQSVGDVFNDAAFGRNPEAQGMLAQLGIRLKRTKDGAVDVQRAMLDIAKAMEGRNPQTQRKIAQVLGVEGALPFLNRGRAAVQRDLNDAMRSGALITDDQRRKAEELTRSTEQLTQKWEGLKRAMTEKWVIPWLGPLMNGMGRQGGFVDNLTAAINGDRKAGRRILDGLPWNRGPRNRATGFGEFAGRIEHQESRGRQFDRKGRPLTSSAGAIGVMQMLPSTAEETARRNKVPWSPLKFRTDADYNRRLGRLHLWGLQQKYGGSEVLAGAAYNAGEGRLDGRWVGKGKSRRWEAGWLKTIGDPRKGEISEEDFAKKIPIPETRDYVMATAGLGGMQAAKTEVNVRFQNAPAGLQVQASGARDVQTSVKVERAMQDAE